GAADQARAVGGGGGGGARSGARGGGAGGEAAVAGRGADGEGQGGDGCQGGQAARRYTSAARLRLHAGPPLHTAAAGLRLHPSDHPASWGARAPVGRADCVFFEVRGRRRGRSGEGGGMTQRYEQIGRASGRERAELE